MTRMHLFIDTHDQANQTFPAGITPAQFEQFFDAFDKACAEEGVTIVRTHVGYGDGRAFCLTLAPTAEAVRRAHERVGLPFDSITEVKTASPDDTFLRRAS
jgi:hypothetical protein